MINKKVWWHISYWLVGVMVIFGGLFAYKTSYANKIYPGVKSGALDLSGLTIAQAEDKLNKAWDEFSRQGILIKFESGQTLLNPIVTSSENSELVYELISYKPQVVAENAWQVGRDSNWFNDLAQPFLLRFWSQDASYLSPIEVDIDRVVQHLKTSFKKLESPAEPADIKVDTTDNVVVVKEKSGYVVDRNYLAAELVNRAINFSTEPITLKQQSSTPTLNVAEVLKLLPQVKEFLQDKEVVFTFEESTWRAKPAVWHLWLAIKEGELNKYVVYLDENKANAFFKIILDTVNQEAHDAKFELLDGRVKLFEASQEGRRVDIVESLKLVQAKIKTKEEPNVGLVVVKTQPQVTTADIADLGVKEVIGIGRSNFKGSPNNRRHNIKTGANALNGVIIKPEEEFSLIKNLGTIDEAGGYLPELVIKGDKTVPEFGGGLCQIGTTTFRAALASGLPITERRNHSYRVAYYEPAGTDATIYDPKPDFRFKNDTGSNILIQTRVKGDDLIFEFWGTKDGRVTVQTKPRIYNIVKPPPTKIIESEDLPVGKKKCTETAHAGADAEFTYNVTYADGTKHEKVFKSHYVPWQEVCLIGVEKKTSDAVASPDGNSTITPLVN